MPPHKLYEMIDGPQKAAFVIPTLGPPGAIIPAVNEWMTAHSLAVRMVVVHQNGFLSGSQMPWSYNMNFAHSMKELADFVSVRLIQDSVEPSILWAGWNRSITIEPSTDATTKGFVLDRITSCLRDFGFEADSFKAEMVQVVTALSSNPGFQVTLDFGCERARQFEIANELCAHFDAEHCQLHLDLDIISFRRRRASTD